MNSIYKKLGKTKEKRDTIRISTHYVPQSGPEVNHLLSFDYEPYLNKSSVSFSC
ncbi:hypothetical protein HMPREF0554_0842 [Pseudoleptotrichia goodfellowii F0264]|uniref:Uncharacterized protein n=1 Tax=Pseudoleptotrichia goodfellowii F0264 TaxID=596323 RepID=D0GNY8_9FUSO|nr:hypothetical protein HMPREF0554_0842 [Pseudoleptotrichia goodfellowii F0264]